VTSVVVVFRADRLKEKLDGFPERLRQSLLRVMTRFSIGLQSKVKEDKLSGQVLHVRTGTLRRSIKRGVSSDATSVTASVGTNVQYAGAHEFGFNGVVSVRDHFRRNKAQMNAALRTSTVTNRDGSRVTKTWYTRKGMKLGDIHVRAYQRHMVLPERSFLRSALKEMIPEVVEEIRGTMKESF
jgi:phage gpG-like protein